MKVAGGCTSSRNTPPLPDCRHPEWLQKPPVGEAISMGDLFGFTDALGPEKIVHVCKPGLDLRGILVIDNVAAGPSIGGCRMASDVSVAECVRLARAMTFKNAAAGLPHGGGKSVLLGDPAMPLSQKESLIRAFAQAIGRLTDYIIGPDMGTDERCMAWAHDEIGRAVGLPREIGGIPLDEIGATGFGLAVAAQVAQSFCDVKLDGARIAIQGFGAVGKHAARFLARKGGVLVAVSDSKGTLVARDGIDVEALIAAKGAGKSVTEYGVGDVYEREAIIDVGCDIWIPAARPDIIRADNVDRLDTRLILEGANIPISVEAERILHERGVLAVPDFIANAGGVICASVEYHGGTETAAFDAITEKLARNTELVLAAAAREQQPPRVAAERLARDRVVAAMAYRRKFALATE
jgi:glutamate dehydrogenase (NAD(P)+)